MMNRFFREGAIAQALQRLDNKKVAKVMRKFKQGKLNSGAKDGPIVSNRKQAIAIALSEAGISRKRDSIGLALERMDALNIKANYDAVLTLHSGDYIGATFAKPIDDSLREEFGGMLTDMGNYNPFPEQQPTPIKRVSIDVSKLYDIEQVAEAIALHLESLGMRVLRRDDRAMPRSSVVAFSRIDGLRLDAKKVLLKMGGRRPGKKCGGGYIGADKKCRAHEAVSISGKRKLSEDGKRSALELAGKVRGRKGMNPLLPEVGKLTTRSQQSALRVIQGGKAPQDKALDKMSLGQLFTEADRVGSKYQSKSDPIDLGANREAAKILDETGMTALKNKAMGVPTIGQSKPKATVKAPAPVKTTQVPKNRVKAAKALAKAAIGDKQKETALRDAFAYWGKNASRKPEAMGDEGAIAHAGDMRDLYGVAVANVEATKAKQFKPASQNNALSIVKSPARSSEDRINNAPVQMTKKRTTRGRSVDSADDPKRMTDRDFDKLASIDPSDIIDLLADVS
jgi:hypothetical protein